MTSDVNATAPRRRPRIVIVGAGNVATSLAPAIAATGSAELVEICSRSLESSSALAARLPGEVKASTLDTIDPSADIYIISVADHALPDVIAKMPRNDALWLHTAGSIEADVLRPLSSRYGVLYPMQTFSRQEVVDFTDVTIFIEGFGGDDTFEEIRRLAESLSPHVCYADSETRRGIHVAAVFACNFVNHLLARADDLLAPGGLSLEVLRPLVAATIEKAFTMGPQEGQTGPARRGDTAVTDAHSDMLKDDDTRLIYTTLTHCITDYYKDEQN